MEELSGSPSEARRFSWDLALVVIIVMLVVIAVRLFVVQPFFVRGASMEPSFHNGDYLLVDELSPRFSSVDRGDVVIFRFVSSGASSGEFYIKRVIGLPGETVRVEDGVVTVINGEHPEGFALEEPYVAGETVGSAHVRLGAGEYFVLGDNRDASYDSRSWGALSKEAVIGKVLLRAWPLEQMSLFEGPQYSI
ncbi:MAG: signal peptidase I [Candidatus Spechtbacterales bacterium]